MSLRDAVPYVAGAYMAVWLAILVYMLLLGQKVRRLEGELARLEQALPPPAPDVRTRAPESVT